MAPPYTSPGTYIEVPTPRRKGRVSICILNAFPEPPTCDVKALTEVYRAVCYLLEQINRSRGMKCSNYKYVYVLTPPRTRTEWRGSQLWMNFHVKVRKPYVRGFKVWYNPFGRINKDFDHEILGNESEIEDGANRNILDLVVRHPEDMWISASRFHTMFCDMAWYVAGQQYYISRKLLE